MLLVMFCCSALHAEVLTGIDVLERDGFKQLAGKNVALITNQTGKDRNGNRTVDVLAKAPGVKVTKLFSPEHGLFGLVDEKVNDATDPTTGLHVYSLYGKTREPNDEMLAGVDTMIFDIQDVGVRYYTYESTMTIGMQAAAKHKIHYIVLDRPNPITGTRCDGPLADKDKLNFVSFEPIPLMHGLTIGELAQLYNKEYGINADLEVIQMDGWHRADWFDATGLMWTNPSPNMRNLTQAALYPCICQMEQTNLSMGRGTDQPFEYFGAPWIDAVKLAKALNERKIAGLSFMPIQFTPAKGSKFGEQVCNGCYVMVTDREKLSPVAAGLEIAWTIRKAFGEKFEIDGVMKLMKNQKTMDALKSATDPAEIAKTWEADVKAFKKTREQYLLY